MYCPAPPPRDARCAVPAPLRGVRVVTLVATVTVGGGDADCCTIGTSGAVGGLGAARGGAGGPADGTAASAGGVIVGASPVAGTTGTVAGPTGPCAGAAEEADGCTWTTGGAADGWTAAGEECCETHAASLRGDALDMWDEAGAVPPLGAWVGGATRVTRGAAAAAAAAVEGERGVMPNPSS